jgi:hypothetical protein
MHVEQVVEEIEQAEDEVRFDDGYPLVRRVGPAVLGEGAQRAQHHPGVDEAQQVLVQAHTADPDHVVQHRHHAQRMPAPGRQAREVARKNLSQLEANQLPQPQERPQHHTERDRLVRHVDPSPHPPVAGPRGCRVVGAFGVALRVRQVEVDVVRAVAAVVERVGQPQVERRPHHGVAQPGRQMAHRMDALVLQREVQLREKTTEHEQRPARQRPVPPQQCGPCGVQRGRQQQRGHFVAPPPMLARGCGIGDGCAHGRG